LLRQAICVDPANPWFGPERTLADRLLGSCFVSLRDVIELAFLQLPTVAVGRDRAAPQTLHDLSSCWRRRAWRVHPDSRTLDGRGYQLQCVPMPKRTVALRPPIVKLSGTHAEGARSRRRRHTCGHWTARSKSSSTSSPCMR